MATSSRGRLPWLGAILVVALVGAGVFAWWWTRPKSVDMAAVLAANNRGIGYMEKYQYPAAAAAFQDAVNLDPNWLPARINLGIALMQGAGQAAAAQPGKEAQKDRAYQRVAALFEQILAKEPADSWARPYAEFCLGVMLYDQGRYEEARPHFEAVTRIDPQDAAAWTWLGRTYLSDEEEERAAECFRKAVALNPNLPAALQGLRDKSLGKNPKEAAKYMQRAADLNLADWGEPFDAKYSEMGRYGEVIGRSPARPPGNPVGPLPVFQRNDGVRVELAAGTRWATAEDFGTDAAGQIRARVRGRFGGAMAVLDYNRDGKPDLLLLGAVVENGKVRDLLLRNEGEFHFTDVTAEAGLAQPRPSLGCCVADFDNDGYPDVLITGAGEQHLFRNLQNGRFEDVSKKVGLDTLKTVCLGSLFIDLDQDGDLDLIIAQYATPEHARAVLKGERTSDGGGLAVYLNTGEAIPRPDHSPTPPLTVAFRRADGPPALLGPAVPAVSLAAGDLDDDHDLDLLVLADHNPPTVVVNDRLLRFHRSPLPESLAEPGTWNGALVLDVNNDGKPDLVLVGPGRPAVLLENQAVPGEAEAGKWFRPGAIDSPVLLQAQAIDLDLDGWTDVVGLSSEHRPVLLHNTGGKLRLVPEALGSDRSWPEDLVAVAVADLDGNGSLDLVTWSEKGGVQVSTGSDNGNHGLFLALTGRRGVEAQTGNKLRCNADAVGVRVEAGSGEQSARAEYTTLCAGLSQSYQPLVVGLGRHPEAEVVRLRWPDGVWQAELNVPSGQIVKVPEHNLKPTSCPVLFAWNGRCFGFVTDFLGAGSLGESLPEGGYRPPRPEEAVKIEADQLAPLDGQYVLKVAEPMNEVIYLDRLQLVVTDHPADVRVYPDERFPGEGPPPTQDLLAFREEIYPVTARDHCGRDVTQKLRRRDRDMVDGFARRSWLGFAEDHAVELDFGDRLARFGPNDPLVLCLAGWTDYPYPESIWAATQAGTSVRAPVLERLGPYGHWNRLAEIGFPAGLPRMMTFDVTGKLGGGKCVLRLRSNLEVFWDQIFVAPVLERTSPTGQRHGDDEPAVFKTTCLEVHSATLSSRGCPQEYSPDGRQPTLYDYDRLRPVPVARLSGRMTRLGDVTELLRKRDDRFVIYGPGEEVTVRFDASPLPSLPAGWKRSFVLRTWGYSKDNAPFTATGDTIEPLPFAAMTAYPYGPGEHYPDDPAHAEYRRQFNTREVGRSGRR